MKFINVLVFICLFSSYGYSTVVWSGNGFDQMWNNPANWVGGVLPGSSDDVLITGGFSVFLNPIIISTNQDVQSIELQDASIQINANVVVNVTTPITHTTPAIKTPNLGTIEILGTLNVYGAIRIGWNGGLIIQQGGYLSLDGSHPNFDYSILIEDEATYLNHGTTIGFNNIKPNGDPLAAMLKVDTDADFINYGLFQSWEAGQLPVVDGILISDTGGVYNFASGQIFIDIALNNGITMVNTSGAGFSTMTNEGTIVTSQCTTCGGNGNPNPNGASIYVDANSCFGNTVTGVIQSNPAGTPWPLFIDASLSLCGFYHGPLFIPALPPGTPFNPGTFNMSSNSTLAGVGSILNAGLTIQGTVAPGNSPGIITFVDDFSNPSATFEMELAGTGGAGDASGHDQIIFQGASNSVLGTTLEVLLIDGFEPEVGDEFVLFSGPVTGTFGTINLPGDASSWSITYDANEIKLELVSPVVNIDNVGIGTPEPKTKLHVNKGDIYVETIGSGIILQTSAGLCHKLTVDAATGNVIATAVACPN